MTDNEIEDKVVSFQRNPTLWMMIVLVTAGLASNDGHTKGLNPWNIGEHISSSVFFFIYFVKNNFTLIFKRATIYSYGGAR